MTIEDRICALVAERLELGRETYGPFRADDPRDMRQEALEELIDAAIYLAALCLRLQAQTDEGTRHA